MAPSRCRAHRADRSRSSPGCSPTAPMLASVLPRPRALPARSCARQPTRSAFRSTNADGLSSGSSPGSVAIAASPAMSKNASPPPRPSSTPPPPTSCAQARSLLIRVGMDSYILGRLRRRPAHLVGPQPRQQPQLRKDADRPARHRAQPLKQRPLRQDDLPLRLIGRRWVFGQRRIGKKQLKPPLKPVEFRADRDHGGVRPSKGQALRDKRRRQDGGRAPADRRRIGMYS
jgi:hypothetical protein